MATGLAAAGANVVIAGTNATKNAHAQMHLGQLGTGEILSVEADVSSADAVAAMFNQALARFGRLDACFANAGIAAVPTPFVEQTVELWRGVIAVNLEGTLLTIQAAARHMIASGRGGSLVTVSSLGELQGMPLNEPYAASKAAVTAMTLGASVELARHNIRANVVQPGFTRTDMTPHLDSELFHRQVLRRVPLRRSGAPDDFAGIAVYLAGPASSYQTGQTFLIDGGYLRY
jgi:NAD(P)-dependent dehydrogenase (short-subunit alcohol dehydrogenase family)